MLWSPAPSDRLAVWRRRPAGSWMVNATSVDAGSRSWNVTTPRAGFPSSRTSGVSMLSCTGASVTQQAGSSEPTRSPQGENSAVQGESCVIE